jgi:hypothetical protein
VEDDRHLGRGRRPRGLEDRDRDLGAVVGVLDDLVERLVALGGCRGQEREQQGE